MEGTQIYYDEKSKSYDETFSMLYFKVNLVDLVLLANAYGATPSNSKWNPNADIDGNGVVGLTDLVILALHYGQHYP